MGARRASCARPTSVSPTEPLVSVVAPMFNEEENVEPFVAAGVDETRGQARQAVGVLEAVPLVRKDHVPGVR